MRLDLILLIMAITCIVQAFRNGFFTSVVYLISDLGSVIVSALVAKNYAPIIFDKYFREKIINATFEYLQHKSSQIDIKEIIYRVLESLDKTIVDQYILPIIDSLQANVEPTIDGAIMLTDTICKPIIIAITSAAIFFIMFAVLKTVTVFLAKAFKIINVVPVLGFTNKLGGAVIGIVKSFLYIIIIVALIKLFIVVTNGGFGFSENVILNESIIYAYVSKFIPL